mgnify:CR=1 FL=1
MKKSIFIVLMIFSFLGTVYAQQGKRQAKIDSLLAKLPTVSSDSTRLNMLVNLGNLYIQVDIQKAALYNEQAVELAKKLHKKDTISTLSYLLGNLYHEEGNDSAAIRHYLVSLALEKEGGNKEGIATVLNNLGATYQALSNYPRALECLFSSLTYFEQARKEATPGSILGIKNGMANCYTNIASIFGIQKEYAKQREYLQKGYDMYESFKYKPGKAMAIGNIGDVFTRQKEYDSAIVYVNRSLGMYREIKDSTGIERNLSNLGSLYSNKKEFDKALEYSNTALAISKRKKYFESTGYNMTILGEIYKGIAMEKGSDIATTYGYTQLQALNIARNYTDSAIAVFRQSGNLEALFGAYKQLSEIQVLQGDYQNAYSSYVRFNELNDSVYNKENEKKLTQTALNYEFAKKEDSLKMESDKKQLALQKEIELKAIRYEFEKKQAAAKTEKEKQQLIYEQKLKEQQIENEYAQKMARAEALQQQQEQERRQKEALAKLEQEKKDALNKEQLKRQRNILYSSLLGIAGLMVFSTIVFRQRNRVNREKKRSDELLLNILPAEVAEELKMKGSSEAQSIDEVTVLFTDFKGFTQLSEKLTPKELVAEINECFSAFDHIMQKHGVEKIKTIGDAYMAAGGLPTPNLTHAADVVDAALEIQHFMAEHKRKKEAEGKPGLEIRIGVHSGPVVAGIVGVKKFAYDIWGDTVNTASRMESSGETGRVNISSSTYALVKDRYHCVHRGKISAKGKGDIDMYFVEPLPLT